jgi:hypothetical protein
MAASPAVDPAPDSRPAPSTKPLPSVAGLPHAEGLRDEIRRFEQRPGHAGHPGLRTDAVLDPPAVARVGEAQAADRNAVQLFPFDESPAGA